MVPRWRLDVALRIGAWVQSYVILREVVRRGTVQLVDTRMQTNGNEKEEASQAGKCRAARALASVAGMGACT